MAQIADTPRQQHPQRRSSGAALLPALRAFWHADAGAVTADYVLLTATVISMSVSVIADIRTGVGNLGFEVRDALTNVNVVQIGELGFRPDGTAITIPRR